MYHKALNTQNLAISNSLEKEDLQSCTLLFSEKKKYALKRLKDLSLDEKMFKQLRRVLELLYITDHSNIVKFYGISKAPGGYFTLVLQLATGGDLRKYLQNKRINESPVHSSLLTNISCESSNEFTHMSYTACTCKPDTFKQENFTLRQTKYELPRTTELLILLTIDDEDEILLSSTLCRIMENIAYLCSLRESPEWGEGGWKKIVICIISDRNKINKRTLSYLKALGVYQDGFEKSKVNNQT
ncbi:3135_t:CDS:2, partial [Gigaspora rosea]